MNIGEVDIGEADAAGAGEIPGGDNLLGHGASCCRRSQNRRVVGFGDGDVDLFGREAAVAIIKGDRKALDFGLAGREIFHRAVGNAVAPGDVAIGSGARGVGRLAGGERPERHADGGRGDRMDIGEVDVGEADAAGGGEIPGGGDLFGDRTGRRRGCQDRGVIGPGDRDVDLFGDNATMAVAQRNREALNPGLTRGKIFDRAVGDAVAQAMLPPVPVPVVSAALVAVNVPRVVPVAAAETV